MKDFNINFKPLRNKYWKKGNFYIIPTFRIKWDTGNIYDFDNDKFKDKYTITLSILLFSYSLNINFNA